MRGVGAIEKKCADQHQHNGTKHRVNHGRLPELVVIGAHQDEHPEQADEKPGRLAHAGASKTTSPARAACAAVSTARSMVPACSMATLPAICFSILPAAAPIKSARMAFPRRGACSTV